MTPARWDAIVIGGGVNGLATAHLLARAGRRVIVLERRPGEEAGADTGWVSPALVRALGLAVHVDRPNPWLAAALPDGGRLTLWRDVAQTAAEIARLSRDDAGKWPEFCARMHALSGFLERLYLIPAPDVETTDLFELLRLGRLGLAARRLGRQGMIDLLRILPMSAAELLDEWFECDPLKGALGALAVRHLKQGPRSGGTAFGLLHHCVGNAAGVFRQSTSNVGAVLARRDGVELRRAAPVAKIVVRDGRATGAMLATGEEIAAPVVASSLDPRRTLLELVDPAWLDPEVGRALRAIKCRGVAARVTLDAPVAGDTTPCCVAPSLEYLERAYDDAKYGRVSERPALDVRRVDGTLEVHVQYAPYALADGEWDAARRTRLGATVANLLGGGTVRDVSSPRDLESRYGWTEGHAYQGEHTLDQILFMRPVAGWGRHRTPVRGLYLCGAGTHPGGTVQGGAAVLAAAEILKDA